MDPGVLAVMGGSHILEQLTNLAAVLAFFAVIAWFMKLRHDRHVRGLAARGIGADEQRALADMNELARRMEQRVENLERILDNELSGWRSRMPR